VGSRCTEYERNFQETVLLMSELQEKFQDTTISEDTEKKFQTKVKMRFYIEYQYAESFQFFSLFKKQGGLNDGLGIERCVEVSAI
jgi:hypothetical protein